jgi:CheY-like chemotaxis protein
VETKELKAETAKPSRQYLSPLGALALSFGYAVGWGAFIMPGTTFLPGAGPLGTLIGVLFGGAAMVIFAVNYHRLTCRYPGTGGAFTFARKVFGEDHGFLIAWFLWLTYIAILWANATALILIVRFTLGGALQFGFHYNIAGFDVYLGEALLSVAAIVVCAGICLCGRKAAVRTRKILIVDDRKLNLKVLQTMLSRLGVRKVLTAEKGREALQTLAEARDVDIVLTDMSMPVMDGAELVREIRNSPPLAKLAVYVVSADVEIQGKYAGMGFDGMLLKPMTLDKLKKLLADYSPHRQAETADGGQD